MSNAVSAIKHSICSCSVCTPICSQTAATLLIACHVCSAIILLYSVLADMLVVLTRYIPLVNSSNPADKLHVLCSPVVLSVLADLLADKRSHPFFLEWHAPATSSSPAALAAPEQLSTISTGLAGSLGAPQPRRVTAAQLLIGIWREQDEARGLSGPDGLLANPSRPLAGSGARTKWAVGDVGVAGGYGVLQSGRKAVLQRIAEASCPDLLMDKVGGVFVCRRKVGSCQKVMAVVAASVVAGCLTVQCVHTQDNFACVGEMNSRLADGNSCSVSCMPVVS
jgi:hypothetical protein